MGHNNLLFSLMWRGSRAGQLSPKRQYLHSKMRKLPICTLLCPKHSPATAL